MSDKESKASEVQTQKQAERQAQTAALRGQTPKSALAEGQTPGPGAWVKALRPGFIGRFIKAGDLFQLTEDVPFSDNWMEPHEPPDEKTQPTEKEVEEEQAKAVRDHEEADRVRRGKFTMPSVPRSPENRERRQARARAEARAMREAGARPPVNPQTPVGPPAQARLDKGVPGHHETSQNPSRVDENARR